MGETPSLGGEPPDTSAWGEVELGVPLAGGARNLVVEARRGRERLVVRRSRRDRAALDWELDLLEYLATQGVHVPTTVPTDDGRRHDQGVMVQRFVVGSPPRDRADWRRVAATLHQVHQATVGWPQRPGFATAAELLERPRGGDVDLTTMPDADIALLRGLWRPLVEGEPCAIHADVGSGNILVDGEVVVLLDWDEARADVPAFDLGNLPGQIEVDAEMPREQQRLGARAWEVATCWVAEPEYAARELDRLRGQLLDR